MTNDWDKVWKIEVPERIPSFVWLIKHDRLLTRYRLNYVHIGEPYCYRCGNVMETTLRVLRDCPLAMVIWLNAVNLQQCEAFFTVDLSDWIKINFNQQKWVNFWAKACHALWTWRNKLIHDDDFIMPNRPWLEISRRVQHYANQINVSSTVDLRNKVMTDIRWPADPGWVKINTNGASKGGGVAGCGGVIRGEMVVGCVALLKVWVFVVPYVAELWGVLEGLQLVRARGYLHFELNIDYLAVVSVLASKQGGAAAGWCLVQRIVSLLQQNWDDHRFYMRNVLLKYYLADFVGCSNLHPVMR
ncbi:ribonuclease H [Trifolium pratense]|uniref:Ribonuclease H n=1 Tax=Trifolium pratense TaxID=57577 RepID=A0A2K3NFG7_TRIPR|nr:ribonuclease H [Trifolium pratense]